MSGKIIRLGGIYKDLNNLTGISLVFIPALKEINPGLCHRKEFCNADDFNKQRKLCRDAEISRINKFKSPNCRICKFTCGLLELMLPIFDNRILRGVVLTNKIKAKNNHNNNMNIPCLVPKQIASLASVLNYCLVQFKEAIALHQDCIPNSRDKILIQRAKNFIEKNYHNPKLPLRDLAREINTSYFYLCRLFKKELNLTFIQYLTLVKLKAALRLLQNLNLTVAQVSYAVGFSDAQYFDRVFKKVLNCSPKGYRFSSVSRRERIRKKILALLN